MKLRGHKAACKCVGCSPATRKLGMARLKASMKNRRPRRSVGEQLDRDKRASVKKIMRKLKKRMTGKKVRRANPLSRGEVASEMRFMSHLAKMGIARRKARNIVSAARYFGKAEGVASTISQRGASLSLRGRGQRLQKRYGTAAMAMNRPRRKHRNSGSLHLIGSNVTLYASGRSYRLGGKIYAGPMPHQVTVVCSLGKGHTVPLNARVSRVEYSNPAKAQRAYGKAGRFYHDFKAHVHVALIRSGVMSFNKKHRTPREIVLSSSGNLWRAQ